MPLRPEGPATLLSPGDQLGRSPMGFVLPSPGIGHTPGMYVVQEGRLSLEMLGLVSENVAAGNIRAGGALELLAPLNVDASRAVPSMAQKSECGSY